MFKVEYLVVAFPDGDVNADVVVELALLVEAKVIRVLDAVVITKDASDEVAIAEFDELDGMPRFTETGGLIGPEDVSFAGADLNPGASAALLLVEDLWAAPLARSGGMLMQGARIPRDLVRGGGRRAGDLLTGPLPVQPTPKSSRRGTAKD